MLCRNLLIAFALASLIAAAGMAPAQQDDVFGLGEAIEIVSESLVLPDANPHRIRELLHAELVPGFLVIARDSSRPLDRTVAAMLAIHADPDVPHSSEAAGVMHEVLANPGSTLDERFLAASSLAYIGYADQAVLDALLEALDHPEHRVRKRALDCLGALRLGALPVVQDIVDFWFSAEDDQYGEMLREAAGSAFWNIWYDAPNKPAIVVPELDHQRRIPGVWILAEMARGEDGDEGARRRLEAIIHGREVSIPSIRRAAVKALAITARDPVIEEPEAAVPILMELLNDRSLWELWPTVAEVLGEAGQAAEYEAADRLWSLTTHRNEELAFHATLALLRMCPENTELVERLLFSSNRYLRESRSAIMSALIGKLEEDPLSIPVWQEALYGMPIESQAALSALLTLEDPIPELVPELIQQLQRRHRTRTEMFLVIRILAKWEVEEALPAIARVGLEDTYWESRRAAVEAIAEMRAVEYAGHLMEIRRDPNPYVRQAALAALRDPRLFEQR